MAEAALVRITIRDDARARAQTLGWTLTQANSVGEAVETAHGRDKSVQFSGTFGGATCILQGSNDNLTWYTLTDPQGNSISTVASAILEQVSEATRYIRPSSSGGDGTQAVICTVFAARPWST